MDCSYALFRVAVNVTSFQSRLPILRMWIPSGRSSKQYSFPSASFALRLPKTFLGRFMLLVPPEFLCELRQDVVQKVTPCPTDVGAPESFARALACRQAWLERELEPLAGALPVPSEFF
jgi:hypothetical protein